MAALLAEVHGLRLAMELSATVTPRVQLALSRLNIEEQRVAQLSGQFDQVRRELSAASLELERLTAEVRDMENGLLRATDEKMRKAIENQQAELKRQLERQSRLVQELRTREHEAAQAVSTEQCRWTDINARLDELERLGAILAFGLDAAEVSVGFRSGGGGSLRFRRRDFYSIPWRERGAVLSGAFTNSGLERFVERAAAMAGCPDRFESLKAPLYIPATDLDTGERVVRPGALGAAVTVGSGSSAASSFSESRAVAATPRRSIAVRIGAVICASSGFAGHVGSFTDDYDRNISTACRGNSGIETICLFTLRIATLCECDLCFWRSFYSNAF
jgi:hypothetical protein